MSDETNEQTVAESETAVPRRGGVFVDGEMPKRAKPKKHTASKEAQPKVNADA